MLSVFCSLSIKEAVSLAQGDHVGVFISASVYPYSVAFVPTSALYTVEECYIQDIASSLSVKCKMLLQAFRPTAGLLS